MKVLLINGSPHLNGCTFTALSEVSRVLNENDINTEIIHVGNKDIRGCIGCLKCFDKKKCAFDDMVNEVAPILNESDGVILGSPVYFASANGGLIAFLDRLFYSTLFTDKTMKVGAAVVSARRGGCTATFDTLNKYFTLSSMPVVSSQYWNMVHGNTTEEVLQDIEGMRTMRVLGKNMAFLIKSILLGKSKYGLPETEPRAFTNFIR